MYVNGRVVGEQNHSLHLLRTLEELKNYYIVSVDSMEVETDEGMAEWLGGHGFPENLGDIPKEARIA